MLSMCLSSICISEVFGKQLKLYVDKTEMVRVSDL